MSLKILTIDDSEIIRLIISKAFKQDHCMVLRSERRDRNGGGEPGKA